MIRELSVQELKRRREQADGTLVVLDVREPWEVRICAISGAKHIPMAQVALRLGELDPAREIVVVCHHGHRSQRVALFLATRNYENVYNLVGGIDAWAREVDPEVPTY
jgi:rhodanese-related sulfurtransferase